MNYPLDPVSRPDWTLLIDRLRGALNDLSLSPTEEQVEAWAIEIRVAMDSDFRRFHTLQHLFDFHVFDPLEQLAVLYHDVVYWNVDRDWPSSFAQALSSVAESGAAGAVLAKTSPLPFYQEIVAVFGLSPGGPTGAVGNNELFSALAFSSSLGALVGRERTLAVAACIEATIPFRRGSPREDLYQRLVALAPSSDAAQEWTQRAVRLANEDVENFRDPDVGRFLAGTWALLPELNPDLRLTGLYSIQVYRRALEGMQKFLLFLQPDMLYSAWRGEPQESVLKTWIAQAGENLDIARQYLGIKVITVALLEAFAQVTGGDVPFSLFMGSVTATRDHRLEALLPTPPPAGDDKVAFLLETGRSGSSSFDLTNSPVSAWLYHELSADERKLQLDRARCFLTDGAASDYLKGWAGPVVPTLARALARFVPTRAARLDPWV